MEFAINKITGKLVSAFSVHKDGSYQNLTKEEWISPIDEIINWEELELKKIKEIPVHYVKEHDRKITDQTITIPPHFSLHPNSPAKTREATQQHKIITQWLFERLKTDDLDMEYSSASKPFKYSNRIKLSQLPIDWNRYRTEVNIKSYGSVTADILLPFTKKDALLGAGIFIEIQLSPQSKETTFERSIERALSGYSTIWLFEKDFNISIERISLKNNTIKINSFAEQLHHSNKNAISKLKMAVEDQCRKLDSKQEEISSANSRMKNQDDEDLQELITERNNIILSLREEYAEMNLKSMELIKVTTATVETKLKSISEQAIDSMKINKEEIDKQAAEFQSKIKDIISLQELINTKKFTEEAQTEINKINQKIIEAQPQIKLLLNQMDETLKAKAKEIIPLISQALGHHAEIPTAIDNLNFQLKEIQRKIEIILYESDYAREAVEKGLWNLKENREKHPAIFKAYEKDGDKIEKVLPD